MFRLILFLSFFIATTQPSVGQDKNFWQFMNEAKKNPSLQEVEQKLNAFYKNHFRGKGSGWKQYQRWLRHTKTHLDADGRIISHAAMNWQAVQQLQNRSFSTEATMGGSWYPLSMNSVTTGHSGRVQTIAFHPSDPNIIFAGTPGGGLWKTTDNGLNWSCISKGIALLGVCGIAVHPVNPDIIYILSGDGNGYQTPSIGVLKTTDGGLNWQETDLQFDPGSGIVIGYDLKMDPENPELLLAATNNGIFRTTNGGLNWTQVMVSTKVFDIEFSPANSDTCYASGISSGNTGEIYRSFNGGANWLILPGTAYSPSKPDSVTRIELAITPQNSNYVYALFGGSEAGYRGLFVSTDRGSGFSKRSDSPNILGGAADGSSPDKVTQVDWSFSLSVSPVDTNIVFTGCVNVWKSTDGGRNWGAGAIGWWYAAVGSPQFVHADIHTIEAISSNEIWVCNDGGIFRTTNGGVDWASPSSNLNALQYYHIDGTSNNANLFYGGTQDNGDIKFQAGSYNNLIGGDGGESLIDYTNPLTVYVAINGSPFPRLHKSTTGFMPAGSHSEITPWIGISCPDSTNNTFIIDAMALNPVNPNLLYVINRDCYKSNNGGTSWTRHITGGDTAHNSISISPSNSAIVYISDKINIRKSLDSGINWTPINVPASVQGRITEIRVDPDNADKLWVSCGNYLAGVKVYEAVKNAGNDFLFTWTNRSGTLPNVPVLTLALQGGSYPALYAGTDIGVFLYTTANAWTPYMNGLPNVRVEDIYLDQANGYITAGSFGMGLWQSRSYGGCISFINHSAPPFIPIYGQEYFEAADSIYSERQVSGGVGTGVVYNAGNSIRMGPGFEVKAGTSAHAYIQGCDIGSRRRKK